jgi:hypothetical protein
VFIGFTWVIAACGYRRACGNDQMAVALKHGRSSFLNDAVTAVQDWMGAS